MGLGLLRRDRFPWSYPPAPSSRAVFSLVFPIRKLQFCKHVRSLDPDVPSDKSLSSSGAVFLLHGVLVLPQTPVKPQHPVPKG